MNHPQPTTGLKLVCLTLLVMLVPPVQASLLLTEIHYNGPASGSDPDEFIELTNNSAEAFDLGAYRFDLGVNYVFPATFALPPRRSLVLARDPGAFLGVFTDFIGTLLDFSGALSNSGETLRLRDAADNTVWSISYDDAGAWPASADGAGDSLQLAAGTLPLASPASWVAAAPTPGAWPFAEDTSATVPLPASVLLILAGLLVLPRRVWRCRE